MLMMLFFNMARGPACLEWESWICHAFLDRIVPM